ncbi:amino acid synthesis family protein [Pigmentiphaga soli]|uniref:Amino acid synthesis family protein n=1 Tax=Pigmentiphaga soli TaxID=1007095 RepID=A0ABP8GIZ9_9BURK
MSMIRVRKKLLNIETVYHEGGAPAPAPLRMGVVAVIIDNPFAGRYVEDLLPFVAEARGLADRMVPELVEALGGADAIQAYGKGALVGVDGELEHGAIWHEAGGWAMRSVLKHAKSVVPAAKYVGAAGSRLHIPLHHVEACYVRSHFNTMEVSVSDAPRPRELLYALAMATGPRVHERLGGLRADQISVHDGQR